MTSRYCREQVACPDPVTASAAFVDLLEAEVRRRAIELIIPVSDVSTILVARHRSRFTCQVSCADATIVERAADKVAILQHALRLGVPVPESIVVADAGSCPPVETLRYPLVVKPARSRVLTDRGWAFCSVGHALDAAALTADLARRPAHEFPLMLQERIVGPGIGIFASYQDGRPVATFAHRRLRERPPWGGVSVLSESTLVPPDAGDYALRLLDDLGWHGVAMVEFKRDERDGRPMLMEINGRFWGSLQLAVDAGVDFPALLAAGSSGTPATRGPYAVGVQERWFWGDVDSLLSTLLARRTAPVQFSASARLQALWAFAHAAGPNLYYDNPKADDWRPFVAESMTWFRHVMRSAGRPAAPAAQPGAVAPAGVRNRTAT